MNQALATEEGRNTFEEYLAMKKKFIPLPSSDELEKISDLKIK